MLFKYNRFFESERGKMGIQQTRKKTGLTSEGQAKLSLMKIAWIR
jgi:hypothetical protein